MAAWDEVVDAIHATEFLTQEHVNTFAIRAVKHRGIKCVSIARNGVYRRNRICGGRALCLKRIREALHEVFPSHDSY